MKRISVVCMAMVMAFPITLTAQKMYVTAGAGYGLPLAPQLAGVKSNSNSVTAVNKSFGMGFMPGVGIGFYLNKNTAAIQLDVHYLKCAEIEVFDNASAGGPGSTYHGSMIRISSSFKCITGNKTQWYARFGPVLGVAGKITEEYKEYYLNILTTNTTEYSGGLSVGFTSAAGVHFHFSKKIGLFTEINMIGQGWAPKYGRVTKYTIGGVDVMNSLTTSQKEITYVDSYYTATSSPNEPDKRLTSYLPFSSWGLNLGLTIQF